MIAVVAGQAHPPVHADAPLIEGEATLELHAVPAATVLGAQGAPTTPWDGFAMLGSDRARARASRSLRAIPDGNRAATLPVERIAYCGRSWALAFKGVGAGAPLYGDDPLHGALRPIVRESWMGESPFGGQGEPNARAGVARTDEAEEAVLFGMPICPVVRVLAVPEAMIEPGHHYRHFSGPIVAEHRLVPSNVRLFHGTGRGLGQAPQHFVRALNLTAPDRLYAFLECLVGTGLAALSLYGASLRECAHGLEGLDYDDAWLDKDSLVAADGALHFVDLESLDWVVSRDGVEAQKRMTRQLARNAYDLFFAADALLSAHESVTGRGTNDAVRRSRLRELFVLAMDRASRSPRVGIESSPGGLTLVLSTHLLPDLQIPLLDEVLPSSPRSKVGAST
jgi:hypothetical protein